MTKKSENGTALTGELRAFADRVIALEGYEPASVEIVLTGNKRRFTGVAWGLASKRGLALGRPTAHIDMNIDPSRGTAFVETLLHELAHVLTDKRDKHQISFYERLFRLAQLFGHERGLTLDEVFERERWYKGRNSASVAARYGVEAAKQRVEARRAAKRERVPCDWELTNELFRESVTSGRQYLDPSHHASLVHVDGVPHRILGDRGWHTYTAERYERCRNCGWEGYVYRRSLSYEVWDPTSGQKWSDIRKARGS